MSGLIAAVLGFAMSPGPPAVLRHPWTPRSGTPQAKFIGAALAAAFAEKNNKNKTAVADRALETLEQKEERVVASISATIDAGSALQPKKTFEALGDFGQASGSLAQTWLTPDAVESVVAFWGLGSAGLARDIRRFAIRERDVKAAPWFLLLLANTFPWTPLLIPLVGRAVNSTDGSVFVPRAFSAERLAAMRRLRRDLGLQETSDVDLRTPQNIDEGIAFFSDGWKIFLRDLRRNRLLAKESDTVAAYAWFFLLAISTFPLTPLLLPVIDKRRPDGAQYDYVPSQFRGRRLAAFARLSSSREVGAEDGAEVEVEEPRPWYAWRPWEAAAGMREGQ